MTIRLVARSVLVVGILFLAGAAFMLRGGSFGFTFAQANGFNLTIDSRAVYNGAAVPSSTWSLKNLTPGTDKFFNLGDVKPGDSGSATISFHVNQNAFVCLDFLNFVDLDNGENEPESLVDFSSAVNDGELAEGTEFFSWFDDGDNVFEVGETPLFGTGAQAASSVIKDKKYVLADAGFGTPFTASSTRYVGMMWCAGNLSVNLGTAATSCDGSVLGNIAQTDSMSVDISLRAVPVSDQPAFRCDGSGGGSSGSGGMGEQIGLFVKCQVIASYGWPLPTYKTECPNGFGRATTTPTSSPAVIPAPTVVSPALAAPARSDRGTRTR